MSILMCIAMVESWNRSCSLAGVHTLSFVDDRYLTACQPNHLEAAWANSQEWHRENKWQLNVAKSHLIQTQDKCILAHNEIPLACHNTLKALGVEMPVKANAALGLSQKRLDAGTEMVARLGVLQLPTYVAQRLLSVIIMPRIAYLLVPRLPPKAALHRVTMAIKRTLGIYRKRISWEANCAIVNAPHKQDPMAHIMYLHMKSICQVRRDHGECAQLWEELSTCPYPNKTRGPIGVWKQCLALLNLEEVAPLLLRDPSGDETHLGTSDWLRVKHYIQTQLRTWMLRLASQKRPNLRGIDQMDIAHTQKLLRRSAEMAREVILIACDGVWTQKICSKMPPHPSPMCTFCELGTSEDPEHIWRICPRWAQHRNWSAEVDEYWRTSPEATRHCLHLPRDAPENIRKTWANVQLQCAQILRHRYQNDAPLKTAVESGQEPPRDVEPIVEAPLLRFEIVYTLYSRSHPWMFPRSQWHRLMRYTAQVRLSSQPGTRCPTVIEFYLSYLIANGRHCFYNGLDTQHRGDFLTTQVDSFVAGVRSFIAITGAPSLLHPPGEKVPLSSELGRFSLGPSRVLALPIQLPNRGEVEDLLGQAALEIASKRQGFDRDVYGLWKQWQPGIPGTQTIEGGLLAAAPLISDPPRRTRMKGCPPWRAQQVGFPKFWNALQACPTFHSIIDGVAMSDFIAAYGVQCRNDLRSLCVAQQRLQQRARSLLTLNAKALAFKHHLAHSASAPRTSCAACSEHGILCFKTSWYLSRCHGRYNSETVAIANRSLEHEITVALARAHAVTLLKRALPA